MKNTTGKLGGARDTRALRRWNGWLAVLFGLQAVALVVFAGSRTVPVFLNYQTKDSLASSAAGHTVLAPAVHQIFSVNLAYLLALVMAVAAVAHLYAATAGRERYESGLAAGRHRVRWIEYALSGGLLLAVLGLVNGVVDGGSLILVLAGGMAASLAALVMERRSRTGEVSSWLPYRLGALAVSAPWLVIMLYLISSNLYGTGTPGYVYWVDGVGLVGFAALAVMLARQLKGQGRWVDYVYGERAFMVLSLVLKALLAWQIFAGAVR